MAMVLAWASMLFSTNSAMALSGLLCESAMIRIAFQSSPIRSLPLSDSFDLDVRVFVTMTRNSRGGGQGSGTDLSLSSATYYIETLRCRASCFAQNFYGMRLSGSTLHFQ